MMSVAGSPATSELAFMFCHIDQPNTAVVTQVGNLLGNCLMTDAIMSTVL